jgi:Ala-tRNA(Pro) deacylase
MSFAFYKGLNYKERTLMIDEKENKVYSVLNNLNIPYIRYEHAAVFTIEQAMELNITATAQHCKNLFIRNRKADEHFLVIIDEAKKVDLKGLSIQIQSTSLSFASEERLLAFLGLTPGSVTPFGLINDDQKRVTVLIDKDLSLCKTICFHPNVNTVTIEISFEDFVKYLQWCGNKVLYVAI